jgi:hypothetical protein
MNKTQKIRELIDEGDSNPEIVENLLDEGYQRKRTDWNTINDDKKRRLLDEDVRGVRSRYKKSMAEVPTDIIEMNRQKFQLEMNVLKMHKNELEELSFYRVYGEFREEWMRHG